MKFLVCSSLCLGLLSTIDSCSAAFATPANGYRGDRVVCQAKRCFALQASTGSSQNDSSSKNRRRFLQSTGALPLIAHQKAASAADTQPLADLPMFKLRLPRNAVGRDYVGIKLMVDGKGPYDFMLDSGLTTEMITPHLQQSLGLQGGKSTFQGLGAGGSTGSQGMVKLTGAALCCGKFADPSAKTLPLPPLTAIVTDFPQEHIDPAHDPVEGMLGQELLTMFDADFDFPKGRLRLWKPGTAASVASKAGLIEIPAAILNETLLLGIRVTSAKAPPGSQPIVGILDCGATFSAVNWKGAQLLGLPPKSNQAFYQQGPASVAVGIDGRPLTIPLKEVQLNFAGDADPQTGAFQPPPKSWTPWKPILIGVGDLPVFSQALGDGRTPFQGPAALIGQDVLSQRRIILETAGRGRKRRVFMSPS